MDRRKEKCLLRLRAARRLGMQNIETNDEENGANASISGFQRKGMGVAFTHFIPEGIRSEERDIET